VMWYMWCETYVSDIKTSCKTSYVYDIHQDICMSCHTWLLQTSHTHTCKTCVCDVIHDSCMSQRHMYVTVTCHSYMYVTVICHSYMTPAWRKDMSSSRVGKSHVWLRDRCMSYMTPPLIHDSCRHVSIAYRDVFERCMSEEMSLHDSSTHTWLLRCVWEGDE